MAFASKDPAEIITVTFDFSALTSTPTNAAVTVSVVTGTDPAPSALKSGNPSIVGAQVMQQIVAGLPGVTYELKCQVDAGSNRYVLADRLPVITF